MMSKSLCSALVLGSMVLASTAFADNSAKTTDTDLAPGYSACMAKAKNVDDKLVCIDDAATYLNSVIDKNFAAIKEKCKSTTHEPSDCMQAAQKAQEAYINYYDMMAVILTYLNPDNSDTGMAQVNEKLNEISKFQAQFTDINFDNKSKKQLIAT